MADVNYINPTGLAPKFDWQPRNALAGMSWVENRDDYRRMYEQQMRMQALAEQEKQMQVEGKRKDIPLQDLERQSKMEFTQGQLPFQGQLGSTGAQAQVNTNAIQASPERRAFEIDKFKQGLNDNQWQQYQRSMGVVGTLTEQAMQIAKSQGPLAAQQWIQQNSEQFKRSGIDLPPYINDPKSWEPLYNAAVQTAKHAQEIGKIDREGMYRQNVAEISGGYGLQQGRERNESNERIAGMNVEGRAQVAANRPQPVAKFSLDQNINRLMSEIANIPEGTAIPGGKIQELTASLEREYEKIATGSQPIRTLAPELQAKHLAQQRSYVNDRLSSIGVQRVQRQPGPSNNNQQQQRPDPLGLR